MTRKIFTALSLLFFLNIGVSNSKPAFENSNFESGDFTNWAIADGWSIEPPVIFPEEKIPDESSFGFFSAYASPLGEWDIIKFYTGKTIGPEVRVLKSKEFVVDEPFLTFTLRGRLDHGKNVVGVGLDSDGKVDVALTELELKTLEGGRERFCLDLSKHLGSKASFFASVAGVPLYVDNIELEKTPPVWINSLNITQTGNTGEISLEASNKYGHPAKGVLGIIVYDFLGKEVLNKKVGTDVTSGGLKVEKVNFPLGWSPQYRIHVISYTEGGAVQQYLAQRWFTPVLTGEKSALLWNDGWEVTKSTNTAMELPEGNALWEKGNLIKPGGSFGYRDGQWREKKAQVWYRREFEVPDWFKERDCALSLDGGGGGILAVFLNGKEISTENILKYHFYKFFLGEIGKDLKRGKNELTLRFRNPDYYLWDAADKNCTEPCSGYHGPSIGIFGNIYLENLPDVYVTKTLIDPSYREKKLAVRVSIKNSSSREREGSLAGSVMDKTGTTLLNLDPLKFSLAPGEEKEIKVSQAWNNPVLWTPESPELLRLSLQVKSDGTDVSDTRFGFREIWVEGRQLLLNGYPLRLLDLTGDVTEKLYLAKKWQGATSERCPFLSFDAPFRQDEIGLLSRGLFEGPEPLKEYKSEEAKERYWKKYVNWEIKSMEYCYNHPACWGWVIGNELGGQGYFMIPDLQRRYIDLAKLLTSLDPNRPVSCDGDLDLFGTTPIWNAHYPHEGLIGLPNNAYFFKEGVSLMDWFPHPPYEGKKPVFLGEAFSGGGVFPDGLSLLGGEKVYNPVGLFDTWKEWYMIRQRAYRDQGVVGYEPFEPFAYVRDFYPIDIYPRDYKSHFYGGRTIQKDIVVFNDIFAEKELTLKWKLGDIAGGEIKNLHFTPGEKKAIPLNITLPKVASRTDVLLRLALEENNQPVGKRWGSWQGDLSIFPETSLKGNVGIMPPDTVVGKMLESFGLEVTPVSDVSKLSDFKVIFTDGSALANDTSRLKSFLEEGGLVFVINQKKDIPGYPVLSEDADTHAHVIGPGHPLVQGINQEGDFSLWGKDNWVNNKSYLKPTEGAARVIVEGGNMQGLKLANLIEVPAGKGRIVFCSLLLAGNYQEEPVAGCLIKNLMGWANSRQEKTPLKAGILLSDNATSCLQDGGFIFDDLASLPEPNPAKYDLLWIDAEVADVEASRLRAFVKNGGVLILNRLTPETLAKYAGILPASLKLKPAPNDKVYGGEAAEIKQDKLFEGISDYELFWKRGSFPRGGPQVRITAKTADFVIDSPEADILTEPAVMGRIKLGKGEIIIDQLRWDEALTSEEKAIRAFKALALNAGVPVGEKKAIKEGPDYKPIGIPANASLSPSLLKGLPEKVSGFGRGKILAEGIPFSLPEKGNNILILGTEKQFQSFPGEATVEVGSPASEIYFLHTAAFGYPDYDIGKDILEYTITLKKGDQQQKEQVKVKYANGIFEYLSEDPGTLLDARQATSLKKEGFSSYLFPWKNPYPDYTVEKIEAKSTNNTIMPMVLGITVRIPQEAQKTAKRRQKGLWSVTPRTEKEGEGRVWAVIGPFANDPPPRGGYDRVYPPEKELDFQKSYPGYGRQVSWRKYLQTPDLYNKVLVLEDLGLVEIKQGLDPENYAVYFYTKVFSAEEKKVVLTFGVDDAGKIWLNRDLVYEKFTFRRGAIPGDEVIQVNLKKGWNDLLVKVVNNAFSTGFYLEFKECNEAAMKEWAKGDKNAIVQLPPPSGLKWNAFSEGK